jgi:uncharacterized Zn finger protein
MTKTDSVVAEHEFISSKHVAVHCAKCGALEKYHIPVNEEQNLAIPSGKETSRSEAESE